MALNKIDTIQELHHPIAFYNNQQKEADLISQIMFGCSVKRYKEINDVEPGDPIKDYLCMADSVLLERLQIVNTGLILIGMAYNKRKEYLIKFYHKEQDSFQL